MQASCVPPNPALIAYFRQHDGDSSSQIMRFFFTTTGHNRHSAFPVSNVGSSRQPLYNLANAAVSLYSSPLSPLSTPHSNPPLLIAN